MLLSELTSNSDEIKKLGYHDSLSTKLWDNQAMKPEVLKALRKIANAFLDALKIPKESVEDIIITGSLANYNYTQYSDIDLHIVVDYSKICTDCEKFDVVDCMDAKKSLWNERHDITVHGLEVELYVQDGKLDMTDDAGVFSVKNNKWLKQPNKLKAVKYDKKLIARKADCFMARIETIIDEKVNDLTTIKELQNKIKNMRKSGLERGGEFSAENLAFKVLRNSGYIKKLYDYARRVDDNSLSLS